MFTVLHRTNNVEILYPCIEILRQRMPLGGIPPGGVPEPGLYLTLVPGHAAKSIFLPESKCGMAGQEPDCVIVMNDNGKTVAKYDL